MLTTAATSPVAPATGPSTGPNTGPAAGGPAPAVALPKEFAVFQTRNPFAHGPKKGGPGAAGGPEAGFVFRGVVEIGGQFVAFVEERGSKRVTQLAVGAALARGKVKSVTLDAMEYESAGASKRIEVGQDLNGTMVPPTPPTSKPAVPGGPPQPGVPPGQPGQPGGPPQPGVPPGRVKGAPPQAVPVEPQ